MSDHPRSLESTRHCVSDRKPKGAIIYIMVAVVAVIIGATSGRHESGMQTVPPVAKLVH